MAHAPGFFLTLEGGDHSGKSSQIDHIRTCLERHGFPVVVTREPGGTSLGERLRHMVLHDPAFLDVSPLAELFIMAAARAEHVVKVIRPALASGKVVVSDRFSDSSLAYQGYGLGLNLDDIRAINRIATGGLEPNLTVVFDVPVSISRSRSSQRSGVDRIESRNDEYFERVRQAFLQLAASEPERFIVIDGTQSPEAVQEQLTRIITDRVIPYLSGGAKA